MNDGPLAATLSPTDSNNYNTAVAFKSETADMPMPAMKDAPDN